MKEVLSTVPPKLLIEPRRLAERDELACGKQAFGEERRTRRKQPRKGEVNAVAQHKVVRLPGWYKPLSCGRQVDDPDSFFGEARSRSALWCRCGSWLAAGHRSGFGCGLVSGRGVPFEE